MGTTNRLDWAGCGGNTKARRREGGFVARRSVFRSARRDWSEEVVKTTKSFASSRLRVRPINSMKTGYKNPGSARCVCPAMFETCHQRGLPCRLSCSRRACQAQRRIRQWRPPPCRSQLPPYSRLSICRPRPLRQLLPARPRPLQGQHRRAATPTMPVAAASLAVPSRAAILAAVRRTARLHPSAMPPPAWQLPMLRCAPTAA